MILHGYWRSSASYRVRVALNLKELEYEYRPVHLLKDGGQQKLEPYTALNPAQLVPTLEHNGHKFNQSLAIIEYLDSVFPETKLIPADPVEAAKARTIAFDLACELQPITNLRVLQYLVGELGQSEEGKLAWIHHWIHKAFTSVEARLQDTAGYFCMGDEVTIADVCLIPQVYNAQRFNVDLTPYPVLMTVYDNLQQLEAVQKARPEAQPDAQA